MEATVRRDLEENIAEHCYLEALRCGAVRAHLYVGLEGGAIRLLGPTATTVQWYETAATLDVAWQALKALAAAQPQDVSVTELRRLDDLGRVVIPRPFRGALGVGEGSSLALTLTADHVVHVRRVPSEA